MVNACFVKRIVALTSNRMVSKFSVPTSKAVVFAQAGLLWAQFRARAKGQSAAHVAKYVMHASLQPYPFNHTRQSIDPNALWQ